MNKLIRIKWRRPSKYFESGFNKGVLSVECMEHEVDSKISHYQNLAIAEGYGRIIENIEIYSCDKTKKTK